MAEPIYFDNGRVIDEVMDVSRNLVQDVVTHNEIYSRLCE